jgi:diguanylate cyclase (GGDEF)-like protein
LEDFDRDATVADRRARGAGRPRSGASCLVAIHGPDLGLRIPLEAAEYVIGRDPYCDIVVPLDDVSRRHCRLILKNGGAHLSDLGSTNGTYLNDEEIPPHNEFALRSGDNIRVGTAIYKFLEGGNVEALYHEEVYRTAIVDGLTQVHNRRFLMEFLERETARCRRHGRPLAVLLIDLDHFKQINDSHGHLAGDYVLREVAALIRSTVRREECCARFGGDEFLLVLPETPLENARVYGERVRGMVELGVFRFGGAMLPVTVSIGVAVLSGETEDSAALLRRADERLYQAKSGGRNRVAA